MSRESLLVRFYAILDRLEQVTGGERRLSECSGRMDWHHRGVYFFREVGEMRTHTGSGSRVIRVGTHALKAGSRTSLWKRLSQHKGQAESGGGNHRGSIFRLLIGDALFARDGINSGTWGQGNSAPREVRQREVELERLVSKAIGGMPFLWLEIGDEPGPESLRGSVAMRPRCCRNRTRSSCSRRYCGAMSTGVPSNSSAKLPSATRYCSFLTVSSRLDRLPLSACATTS